MTRHLTTDPACRRHRPPRTWWQRLRYDRNRGRSCGACVQRLLHVRLLSVSVTRDGVGMGWIAPGDVA